MIRTWNGIAPKLHPQSYVNEMAYVSGNVTIGNKSTVWPAAVIRAEGTGSIKIGSNTHIQDGSVIHNSHQSLSIGDNINVGHAVVIHCSSIGNNCLIGNNSTLLEGVELVKKGNPPKLEQNHDNATYESWCKKSDAEVDWDKPAQDVYNLIRGCNPQPGAWTTFEGNDLKVFDSKLVDPTGAPGEVVEVFEGGFIVAAKHGGILIERVRPPNSGKITANEFVTNTGMQKGIFLG